MGFYFITIYAYYVIQLPTSSIAYRRLRQYRLLQGSLVCVVITVSIWMRVLSALTFYVIAT